VKGYGDEGTGKTIKKRSIEWRMRKIWITIIRVRRIFNGA